MAYRQRWAEYFSLLDADGSGALSSDDIVGGVQATARVFGLKEGSPEYKRSEDAYKNYLQNLIQAADINKDGEVSKEEFLSAVDKIVADGADKVPAWFHDAIRTNFSLADVNNSGDLSLEEIITLIKRTRPEQTEADITNAYNWALNLTGSTTLDLNSMVAVNWVWSSSANATPEADLLLPYFKKL